MQITSPFFQTDLPNILSSATFQTETWDWHSGSVLNVWLLHYAGNKSCRSKKMTVSMHLFLKHNCIRWYGYILRIFMLYLLIIESYWNFFYHVQAKKGTLAINSVLSNINWKYNGNWVNFSPLYGLYIGTGKSKAQPFLFCCRQRFIYPFLLEICQN